MPDVPTSELPGHSEFLDLEHGNTIQLRILRGELGTLEIHPTNPTPRHIRLYMQQNGLTTPPAIGTPITVRIPVLRVHGTRLDAPSPLTYWDISSKRLQAQLYPRIVAAGLDGLTVTLTANGYKPTKVYSVEVG